MAAFLPNLGFEAELLGRGGPMPRPLVERIPHLLSLAAPEDVLLVEAPFEVPDALRRALPRVVPVAEVLRRGAPRAWGGMSAWGASAAAGVWARRLGLVFDAPPPEVVARVNSKAWSAALARRWGIDPPGVVVCEGVAEVVEAVAALPVERSFVLKEALGFGGQGRLLGRGGALSENDGRWLARALALGPVVVEPWLDRRRSFSVQLYVGRGGGVEVKGILRGLETAGGRYLGSVAGPGAVDASTAGALEAVATRVGEALAAEGYFGPAGVDALEYDLDGVPTLRPLLEVNARHTFGAVALGWVGRVAPGRLAAWRLVPPEEAVGGVMTSAAPAGARVGVVFEGDQLGTDGGAS